MTSKKKDNWEKEILLLFQRETKKRIGIKDDLIELKILDSLAIVNLILKLEKELKRKIPNEELQPHNFVNISSIVYMVRKLKKK